MQPERLGPYRIGERLGRGGMGSVYEAIDTDTGQTVAVKVLAPQLADDAGLQARFRAEIDTLKSLRHPGIVQLLAFGEENDQPYFAMELVRGKTVEQLLRSGRRFTWRETVAAAGAIARALKVAHDHGVIHRDLKPSNLLIADGQSPGEGMKLADFGIAKLFGAVAHTAHGNIVGTAEYMAPEQATGQGVDGRADLYSLGLVMYAMLAGRPPFRGVQATEVIEKQRSARPPRVASVAHGVPPELDALIDRLLAKDPDARPASALALQRLLAAIEAHVPDGAAGDGDKPPEKLVIADLGRSGEGPAVLPHPATGDRTTLVGSIPSPPPRPTPPGSSALADAAPAAAGGPMPGTPTAGGTVPDGGGPARPPAAATAVPSEELTRAAASGGASTTRVDTGVHRRHTTLAELDRADAEMRRRAETRQTRWQRALALAIAATVLGGGWWLLQPPSADTLYARIKEISTADGRDLRDAAGTIERFLALHPDDPRAGEVAALERTIAIDRLERRARRKARSGRLLSAPERDYRAAMAREEESPAACIDALEALVALEPLPGGGAEEEDSSLWHELARRQIARLAPLALEERQQDAARIDEAIATAARLEEAALASDAERRAALRAERRTLLEGLIGTYAGRPHAEKALERVRALLAEPAPQGDTPPGKTPSDTPSSDAPPPEAHP